MSQESYLTTIELILDNTLDDSLKTYTLIDKGWTNLVFDVNDKWIFRFARFLESEQITVEKAFLPIFAEVSPVTIPKPFKLTNSTEDKMIVYPKIKGERFSQKFVSHSDNPNLKHIYQSLGAFFSSLHTFDYQHKNLIEYPYGGASFWSDLWPQVSPLLSKRVKEKAFAFFTENIELLEHYPAKKTITHSDLGTNNLLFDAASNQLTGVIDFGDIAIADPAIDFSSFYRNFGRNFVENILAFYEPSIGDNFWLRVDYASKRKLFFVSYFAMHYGYESDLPDLVKVIEAMF